MFIKRVQVPIWHAKFLYMNLQNNFIIAIIVGIMVVQEEEVNEWMSGCGMQLTGGRCQLFGEVFDYKHL